LAFPPCALEIRLFDGTRRAFPTDVDVLYRVLNGNQDMLYRESFQGAVHVFNDLPFYDNLFDNYTIITAADGYQQTGFTSLKLSPSIPTKLDLMLIRKQPKYDFMNATWDAVSAVCPFLSSGVAPETARARYEDLRTNKPDAFAGLLNITTVMRQTFLRDGTPAHYVKEIKWDDSLAQDRFFAYCDPKLIDEVRQAAVDGTFAPEPQVLASLFHSGSTASWKQVEFDQANLQLTFHENDTKKIGDTDCIGVEPDIDYFKDFVAHSVLEVIPNKFSGGLTNAATVYVLRWVAGREVGVPDFTPPYTITN
jgi:hypothetical protein